MKVRPGYYAAPVAYGDELRRAAQSAVALGGPEKALALGAPVIVETIGYELEDGHVERWCYWRFTFERSSRSWDLIDLGDALEAAGYSRV